jgi:hypothetical protein
MGKEAQNRIALRDGCGPGGIVVKFRHDGTFRQGFRLWSAGEGSRRSVDGLVYDCKPVLEFDIPNRSIMIREVWRRVLNGEGMQQWGAFATLRLKTGLFRFEQYQFTGGNDFIFTFVRPSGEEWPKPEIEMEPRLQKADEEHKQKVIKLLQLPSYSEAWDNLEIIETTLLGGGNCDFFSLPDLQDFMEASDQDVAEYAQQFATLHDEAIAAEADAKLDQQHRLRRHGVPVRIVKHNNAPGSMTTVLPVRLRDQPRWKVEVGQQLMFQDAGIFKKDAPTPNKDNNHVWMADVKYVNEEKIVAVSQNAPHKTTAHVLDTTIEKVTVTVSEVDPMRRRQERTMDKVRKCFRRERGEEVQDAPFAELAVPCSPYLLNHRKFGPDQWAVVPMPMPEGQTSFDKKAEYGLEQSHGSFLDVCVQTIGRLAGAIGPPGSGKTTLVMKLVGILLIQALLIFQRVMTVAHSQTAAKALLEKAAAILPSMFGMDKKQIVFVETDNVRKARLAGGGEMSPELEWYTIENHRTRLARTDTHAYRTFLQYLERPKDKETAVKWQEERDQLDKIIRKRARVLICTISTAASDFFKISGNELHYRFQVDVMIVDEASQAIWPNIIEAWIVINPRFLFFCGDPKQLSPYYTTQKGRQAWRISPLESLIKRVPQALRLLDVGFRMPQSRYGPILDTWCSIQVIHRQVDQRLSSCTWAPSSKHCHWVRVHLTELAPRLEIQ